MNTIKLNDKPVDSSNWTLTQSLQILSKNGYPVPETRILIFSTLDFCEGLGELCEETELRLSQMVDPQRTYGVFPDDSQEKTDGFSSSFRLKQVNNILELKTKIRAILQNEDRS